MSSSVASWPKTSATPIAFKRLTSAGGMTPPTTTGMSSWLARSRSTTRWLIDSCAPTGWRADDIDALLDGGGDDDLGRDAQPGVDDLHAGVAQGRGDDLGAAVVAVEARLADEDAQPAHQNSGGW
jgi:hypothetical protein